MNQSSMPYFLTAGFVVGLGFGWLAFRPSPPAQTESVSAVVPEAKVAVKSPATPGRPDPGSLREVERYFLHWGGYAVWENDVTEIALWNEERQRHDRFFQIVRVDGEFYFRTLGRLRRPLIDHGVQGNLPIQFTETAVMRAEFYRNHPDYKPDSEPRAAFPPRPPQRHAPRPRDSGVGLPPDVVLEPAPPLTPGGEG